ncbi:hypothetical protein COO60DRAFT_743614 [Scenedesmus sp. NREL 46B-D3]|nr:hypothetical protein COO60DRAFT_743614 [Scenedesmus sp. NREL 46B-D3]
MLQCAPRPPWQAVHDQMSTIGVQYLVVEEPAEGDPSITRPSSSRQKHDTQDWHTCRLHETARVQECHCTTCTADLCQQECCFFNKGIDAAQNLLMWCSCHVQSASWRLRRLCGRNRRQKQHRVNSTRQDCHQLVMSQPVISIVTCTARLQPCFACIQHVHRCNPSPPHSLAHGCLTAESVKAATAYVCTTQPSATPDQSQRCVTCQHSSPQCCLLQQQLPRHCTTRSACI